MYQVLQRNNGKKFSVMSAFAFFVAAIAASPLHAQQHCPVGETDLDYGVLVEFEDGSTSRFYRLDNGLIREDHQMNDDSGDGSTVDLLYGMYTVQFWDTRNTVKDASSHQRVEYAGGLNSLPKPAPGLNFATEMVWFEANGLSRQEHTTFSFGPQTQMRVDGCGLIGLRVDNGYRELTEPVDEEEYEVYMYYPKLGFGVLLGWYVPGEEEDLIFPVKMTLLTPDL